MDQLNTDIAEDVPAIKYGIGRYSLFQGALVITGWVEVMGAPITGVRLVLPNDDQVFPLTLRPEDGDEGASRVSFDQRLDVMGKPGDVANAELIIEAEGIDPLTIAPPGLPMGDATHQMLESFIHAMKDRGQGHLLEIGSRARSGLSRRHFAPPNWDYTGLDIMEGPNVDVTGDAHALSSLFENESFDAVMSFSVFEHLLMPWKVAIELSRVMKTGGIGLIMTHQTWPLHEQPWDFWRFSDQAWHAIFNPATGFVIEQAAIGEASYIVPRLCHPAAAFDEAYQGCLSSAVRFKKISESTVDWPVDLASLLPTAYPEGETVIEGTVKGVKASD